MSSESINANVARVAIIGLGQMGAEHCRNIILMPETAEVVGCVDRNLNPAEAVMANLKSAGTLGANVRLFASVEQLMEDRSVDAFVIASPNFTHADILKQVIPLKLPILVEKPLCTTIADCQEVERLAAQHGTMVWVGMEYRYMRPIARLIEEVEQGTVGNLKMVAIREHRFPFLTKVEEWNRFSANTGGTMVEKCCHFFDLMNRIVRSRPVSVYCNGAQDVNHLDERYGERVPDIIDNSMTVVKFENGVRASLDLCMFAEVTRNQEEICVVGDGGKVEALIPESVVLVGQRDRRPITSLPPDEKTLPKVERISLPVDETLRTAGYHEGSTFFELKNFFNAARNNIQPEVSVADGMLAVAMGVAAEMSIKEDRVVRMSEVLPQS